MAQSVLYSQWTLQSAEQRPGGFHTEAEGAETQKRPRRTQKCRWPPPRPCAAPPEEGDAYAELPAQDS